MVIFPKVGSKKWEMDYDKGFHYIAVEKDNRAKYRQGKLT